MAKKDKIQELDLIIKETIGQKLIPQFAKLGVPIIMICSSDDEYVKLNKFMDETDGFETVLTDSKNNILLLGNPIHSIKIKELFLEKIQPN